MTSTPSCCGHEMRRITIQTQPSTLTLLACSRCEQSGWLADGQPTPKTQVIEAMRTLGRAKARAA